jgi:hypothetical protein
MTESKTARGVGIFVLGLALLLASPQAGAARLEAWGSNWYGERDVPAGNDYVDVACGRNWCVALRSDGSLVSWGDVPGTAPSGNNWIAVDAHYLWGMALRNDGVLVSWGTAFPEVLAVPGGMHVSMACGGYQGVGIRLDNSLTCWGWQSAWRNVRDKPGGSDYVQVTSGAQHSLALRRTGTIAGWGNNTYGQYSLPGYTDYVAVDTGDTHTIAVRRGGSAVCVGTNTAGQCNVPAGEYSRHVGAGNYYTVAIRTDGSLAAWGTNQWGICDVPAGHDFLAVSPGHDHAAALRLSGVTHGSGDCRYEDNGFAAGGYGTDGLVPDAVPLPATVTVEGLQLDAGYATLEVDYNPAELAVTVEESQLRLYRFDDGLDRWVLAGLASNINQSSGQFVAGAPTDVLGDWGVHVEMDRVWANIDHASVYAIATIPEPATLALLALGGLALIRRRR